MKCPINEMIERNNHNLFLRARYPEIIIKKDHNNVHKVNCVEFTYLERKGNNNCKNCLTYKILSSFTLQT